MVNHAAFIQANTLRASTPFVPEISLFLATEITPIWQATEVWLDAHNLPPPYWAFAWPGSQALARHVLDHPSLVAGKRVLDFAAGSGQAAIACAMAGAAHVEACEIDPFALAAIALNAVANTVTVHCVGDVLGGRCRWDLILCGDVCYEATMAATILPWLRDMALDATVWLADPGRAYVPRAGLAEMTSMDVPTITELEDRTTRHVVLSRLLADQNRKPSSKVGP